MRWSLVLALVACGGGKGGPLDGRNPNAESGRVCDLGSPPPTDTVIASPSLDCDSQICLNVMGTSEPLCTAECVDGSDCTASLESACTVGFTCQIVLAVGPFACRRFCVCNDRLQTQPVSCLPD